MQTFVELDKIRVEKKINQTLTSKYFTDEQKKIMKEYYDFCKGSGSKMKSDKSMALALSCIKIFAKHVKKEFNEVTKEDVERYDRIITSNKSESYAGYLLIQLKRFYKWLYQTDNYPKCVRWLKPRIKHKTILIDELPTDHEVKRMLECNNGDDFKAVRDRCVLMVFWDSGCRITEILGCLIGSAIKDEYGYKLSVNGKTGKREVRLIEAVPYLNKWLECHPDKHNLEAPLFTNAYTKKPLQRMGTKFLIEKMAKRAGVVKKITPHLFRSRKCTAMANEGIYNEKDLCLHFGWQQNSMMPSHYNKSSYKEMEEKILIHSGLKKGKEIKESELKPTICPKCGNSVLPEKDFCVCGALVNIRAIDRKSKELDNVKKVLDFGMNSPETKDKLAELLTEIVGKMK